ncbi:MAG: PKD domain-containing protein [Methanomassiliicoccales archaeon]|nr:MAG: PKD domain-containing protein [Methanomassiliicoccales archaeon]
MNKNGKIIVLVLFVLLFGVYFTTAMPVGDFKDHAQEKSYIAQEEIEPTVLDNPMVSEIQYVPVTPIELDSPKIQEPLEASLEEDIIEADFKEVEPMEAIPIGVEPLDTDTNEVDAKGPYGTVFEPYFEGEEVTLEADIIGGDVSDYYFRWDVNNNGTWEKDDFGVVKGSPTHTHTFNDDHIGQAKVEAWDGVSMKTVYKGGQIWNDDDPDLLLDMFGNIGTIGLKFEIIDDIIVNQLVYFRQNSTHPIYFYNIRLWNEMGTILAQASNLIQPDHGWAGVSIPPITLNAGGTYIISAFVLGSYYPGDDNPGISQDGRVNPTRWMRGNGNSYPQIDVQEDVLPFLDIYYDYPTQEPDVLLDYADVYVDNAAPSVDAGPDQTVDMGQTVIFSGIFTDSGSEDTHTIEWNFGDGNTSTGTLTPTHVYDEEGVFTVNLTVTDDDGGKGSDTLTVIVSNPSKVENLLKDLIDEVEGMDLHRGITNSLVKKLENTLSSFKEGNDIAAKNKMNAFINEVEAQRDKKITGQQADSMIFAAQRIIDGLSS